MKEINEYKPDLVYCIVPPNSLVKEIGRYKNKNKKVKIIYDIYDMWPESFPYKSKNAIVNLAFKKWASLRDKYINYADLLIAVSQKEKEELDNKYHMIHWH